MTDGDRVTMVREMFGATGLAGRARLPEMSDATYGRSPRFQAAASMIPFPVSVSAVRSHKCPASR